MPVGVNFAGVAKSVNFSGAANYIAFDNITLGSQTPGVIPEPGTMILFVSGLGVAAVARRRAKCA
ncbi:MAG: PEP-CTERM sorting domain-containing protein [Chthonomonadetes bacterium]|nr:PEP-CTERM sorting domain-containing protein [Chthonomonadetes bacterium]